MDDPSQAGIFGDAVAKAGQAFASLEQAVASGDWERAALAAASIAAGMSVLEEGFRAVGSYFDTVDWDAFVWDAAQPPGDLPGDAGR